MAIQFDNSIRPREVTPAKPSATYWADYGRPQNEWFEPFKKFADLEYKELYTSKDEAEKDSLYEEKLKVWNQLKQKYTTEEIYKVVDDYYKISGLRRK